MTLTDQERLELLGWFDASLHEHILGLTTRQQDCVLLRFVEDYTEAEIGERLGITQRAVSWHLAYAIQSLKENETFVEKMYRPYC